MRRSLLWIAFAILCAFAVLPVQAAESLRIYRLDGSKQCEEGTGRSLERDARALRRLGIRIRAMEKLHHPTMIVIMMAERNRRAPTPMSSGRAPGVGMVNG